MKGSTVAIVLTSAAAAISGGIFILHTSRTKQTGGNTGGGSTGSDTYALYNGSSGFKPISKATYDALITANPSWPADVDRMNSNFKKVDGSPFVTPAYIDSNTHKWVAGN